MVATNDKGEPQTPQQRAAHARETVRTARAALRGRVDDIVRGCDDAPRIAMERLRARFTETARRLHAADLDPAAELFDGRFTRRVERTATGACRLNARTARIEAEPEIRAGKAARNKHRATEKQRREEREREATMGPVPRPAKPAVAAMPPKPNKVNKKQEAKADEAIVRELRADAETAKLVPIWMRVREEMHREAAKSGGKLTPLEAFVRYVDEHLAEVERELAELHSGDDRKNAVA